jgi:tetratricopeptide (TPR) repeat protein
MSHRADMALVWQKIDAAEQLDDPQERAELLEDVVRMIGPLTSEHVDDAPGFYAVGYSWYMHPRRLLEPRIYEAAEDALRTAVELNPDDALAWLYLGHNAYDFGHYDSARDRFVRVNVRQMSDYLRLKVEEMSLCCDVLLNGLGPSLDCFDKFVCSAETLEPVDIWPQQLAKLLASEARRLTATELPRLQAFAQRLDKVGQFGPWFQETVEKSWKTPDNLDDTEGRGWLPRRAGQEKIL